MILGMTEILDLGQDSGIANKRTDRKNENTLAASGICGGIAAQNEIYNQSYRRSSRETKVSIKRR